MIDERYKDPANFDEDDVGDRLEVTYCLVESGRTIDGFGICVKMLQQEEPEGHDPGKLMQLAQDKGPAQTNRQLATPLPHSVFIKPTDFHLADHWS